MAFIKQPLPGQAFLELLEGQLKRPNPAGSIYSQSNWYSPR
jgi:hypothetical protein